MEGRRVSDEESKGLQRGIDSSIGQTCEGSDSPEAKRKRVEKNDVSRVQEEMDCYSDLNILNSFISRGRTVISVEHKYAKIALDYYEQRQGGKFEIQKVLFSNRAKLVVPGYEGVGLWCHVGFLAKPRNGGHIDDCPKHFFGEMLFDLAQEKYNVTYCSIFEPSDPRNVDGCVFCPPLEVFLHPADGCPAGGRESDKFMAQNGMNASQGQRGGCSKRHPDKRSVFRKNADADIIEKAIKCVDLECAKIALEFYEKCKGGEFEIVEVLFGARDLMVVPESKCEEWWCHVVFTAKPRNTDCSDVSTKYFFGELSHDTTTRKYSASYCEIFKPTDRKITHGCTICPPLEKHPFKGFRAGFSP